MATDSASSANQSVARIWQLRNQTIRFTRQPVLMGIVNVTPDSFSDGGKFYEPSAAVEQALRLEQQGAGILDIGGESTRPYSDQVTESEELRRVLPVVEQVCKQVTVPVSIDTSKSEVARRAVLAGAQIINDVTGLTGDPGMIDVALETGAGVCAMHMQGNPQTMQDDPCYVNVVDDVYQYLRERKQSLLAAGIATDRICLDPGIGFGKTHDHNLALLRRIADFHSLNCPLLVGHSRKGFVGKITHDKSEERTAGTIAATLHLANAGVQIIRVHDVQAMKQALLMQDALVGDR